MSSFDDAGSPQPAQRRTAGEPAQRAALNIPAPPTRRRDRSPADLVRSNRPSSPALPDEPTAPDAAVRTLAPLGEPHSDAPQQQSGQLDAAGVPHQNANATVERQDLGDDTASGRARPQHSPLSRATPKHARLTRRDIPLTAQQCAALDGLTKEVMADPRRQQVSSAERERITDATLIRISIDLLMSQHADRLQGVTEDELRASVGLPALQI